MKIAIVSQPEYFRAFYGNDLDVLGEVREFPFNYTMTEEDFTDLEEFNADFNFFFRGEFFPNNVLKRLEGHTIALSSEPFPNYVEGKLNYSHDSLARFEDFKNNIVTKVYDYIFHYDESSLQYMLENGLRISGEFVFPVALSLYKKKNFEKRWDVFFIGRSTGYRESFLYHLKHYKKVLHIAHGIYGNELVDYINQSKLVLNLHAENEISWEPRVQMLLACGSTVLSHKITRNKYLKPGVDYIEIDNDDPADLYSKVEYYLAHEDECLEVADNGLRAIKKNFDALANFKMLIEGIKGNRFNKVVFEAENHSEVVPSAKRNKKGWKVCIKRVFSFFSS